MEQIVPNITELDIKRIIKRDFPKMEFEDINDILKKYNSENSKSSNRVYASILKLSNSNITLLKKYVDEANYDYRDIISMAEYPNYSEHAFEDDLAMELEKRLINDDWIQYESWLNKV